MPSKSPAQHRLMEAVAHDPGFAKRVGIPVSVGRDYAAADKRMVDGGAVGDTIQPTPRSGGLGALADVLEWLRTQGNKASLVDPGSWLGKNVGAGGLGSLILGQAPEAVDRMSYGASPMHMPPPGTGGYLPDFDRTLSVDPAGNRVPGDNSRESVAGPLLDAALAGQAAYPLAKAAAKGTALGALGALSAGVQGEGPLRHVLAPAQVFYAVKPKGGNVNTERLNGYLSNIGVDPQDGINDPIRGGMSAATDAWGNKQLRNYIAKDLGSPTDPLLAVEKDYPDLHMPEGGLTHGGQATVEDLQSDALWGQQGRPGKYAAALAKLRTHADLTGSTLTPDYATNQLLPSTPLTPWGAHSGGELYGATPEQYKDDLMQMSGWMEGDEGHPVPDWVNKAAPDTKIWGLSDPFSADDHLGFSHVLDYLNAAQAPYHALGEGADNFMPKSEVNPWVNRMLNEEDLEHFNDPAEMARFRALHAAGLTMTPEQVARTSVADAVRKTAQWNAHLAEQGSAAAPDLARGIQAVHKDYGDGMRWVKLGQAPEEQVKLGEDGVPEGWTLQHAPLTEDPATGRPWLPGEADTHPWKSDAPEGSHEGRAHVSKEKALESMQSRAAELLDRKRRADLEAGLNAEGSAMGHCVGGYCDQVANAGTQIYSLRDAKNNPHVTVEVRGGRPQTTPEMEEIDDIVGLNSPYEQAALQRFDAAGNDDATAFDYLVDAAQHHDNPAVRNLATRRIADYAARPQEIVQIKGKQNAAPVAKYLPYVQDFVKSGQWGRVGDLQNTGLMQNTAKVGWYTGPRPVDFPPGLYSESDVRKQMEGFPEEHIQGVMSAMKGKGYAHGGLVQSAQNVPKYSKKAALLARLQG